jgi:O-antigen/teichoic acid export membrane protein
VGIAFGMIVGAFGIGVALLRGVTDYRQKGTITWGWAVVALVFLAIAVTPVV